MQTYRFAVVRVRRSIRRDAITKAGVVSREYQPYELFNKWINSDLGVAIVEQIMRHVYGDTAARNHIFRIVNDYIQSKGIYNSQRFADDYYEVVRVFHYGVECISVDADEAKQLIESGIIKVTHQDSYLDIDTILNEKEVHGKL